MQIEAPAAEDAIDAIGASGARGQSEDLDGG